MLNNNCSSLVSSVKFDSIFTPICKIVDKDTSGLIFREENFTKDWESIYVNPITLPIGNVEKGMRCITRPTILITTRGEMAFVLASNEQPVYFASELEKTKESGYILAYEITPEITPEYIYYMCRYGVWRRMLSEHNQQILEDWEVDVDPEKGLPWIFSNIGKKVIIHHCTSDFSTFWDELEVLTPARIMGLLRYFKLPSQSAQKNYVDAAIEQENKIVEALKPKYSVPELVTRYLALTTCGLFRSNGIGLLTKVYSIAAGNYVKSEILNLLSGYEFKEDILSLEELNFLSKHLDEVFTLVISSNNIILHPSEGFIQPQEVTDFMCKIASFPEDVVVYNPFAGADSYAITLPNRIVGEELYNITWALGQIRIFANNAENRINVKLGDSFESMASGEKFKAIITSPAYLVEKGQQIADIVKLLYNKLEDDGKLVCIVTAGFLSGHDNNTKSVRESLIRDKVISAVVMLPSNIFTGTGVSQAAIVITKGTPNEEILFADATGYTRFAKSVYRATTFDAEQFLKDLDDEVVDYGERGRVIDDTTIGATIKYSEIVDSDLTPARYLTPKPSDGIALSELAVEVEELRGKDISAEFFLSGSSIPAVMHRKPFTPAKVEDGKVATAKKHVQMPENAVVLAIVNGNVRTVYTEGFAGTIAFPAGFIKVLKPIDGISAKYLAAVLSTKIVADQIKAQTVGLTIPRLNKLDLSQILVPIHGTVEEREQLIAEVLSSEMSDLESELQETLDSQKREVRSTRHAMIQTLSALSSNWEQLKMFAERHEGGIKMSDTIGRINPITVKDLMGSIGYAMSTLQRQVESLRFEKPDWGKDIEINPYKFINDYIATHSSPSVRMLNIGNDNVADFPYFDDETGDVKYHHTDAADIFYAPVRLLERIFNNIVANAKAHGFTGDSMNNEIRFDWKSEDGVIVITIANNGLPLKDGVSGEDVLMSGFTTALNENASDGTLHSGQGGFEIKSLMEGLGSVEVISQPDSEFPVIYKLTFEKTNFETINFFED